MELMEIIMKEPSWNLKRIEDFMEENNFSKKDFAKECGISIKSLNKIFENNLELKLMYFVKIAKRMKAKFNDLIVLN